MMRHRADGSPIPDWSDEADAFAPDGPAERPAEQIADEDALEHVAEFCSEDEQADGGYTNEAA